MKLFTQEQIDNKIKYLREQLYGDTPGIYATLFIRTYYYILLRCRERGRNWCFENDVKDWEVAKYAYKTVRDGRPDHMGSGIIRKIKDELCKMGFISYKEEPDVKITINKEIDFLDSSIDDFIAEDERIDKDNSHNIANKVFNYLCDNGINIYVYPKRCWKCGELTPVYSYFLDLQIKNEFNNKICLNNKNLAVLQPNNVISSFYHRGVFSEIGIGEIEKLDKCVATKISTVKKAYSKKMNRKYYMNLCQHCNSVQGINFVVYYPEEINNLIYEELQDHLAFKIQPEECGLIMEDLIEYIE